MVGIPSLLLITLLCWAAACGNPRKVPNEEKSMESQVLAFASRELRREQNDLEAHQIESEFFKKWQFWRINDGAMPPMVLVVATYSGGVCGLPMAGGFKNLVAVEPVQLSSPEAAVRYVTFFISVTDLPALVVDSVEKIPGTTPQERKEWVRRLGPPTGRPVAEGYLVDLWIWKHEQLLKGRFAIDKQGAITSDLSVAAPRIGVEIGME